MKTDTQPIRDRLLAVLRGSETPLSTAEVCVAAGPYYVRRAGCIPHQHEHTEPADNYYSLAECDGDSHLLRMPLAIGSRGYTNLRALEGQGLIRSIRTAERRSLLWVAVAGTVDAELLELESLWAAS